VTGGFVERGGVEGKGGEGEQSGCQIHKALWPRMHTNEHASEKSKTQEAVGRSWVSDFGGAVSWIAATAPLKITLTLAHIQEWK
jgi:hypothetical protein